MERTGQFMGKRPISTGAMQSPPKVFKVDRLTQLEKNISCDLNNIDIHISAGLYKISPKKITDAQKMLDVVSKISKSLSDHVTSELTHSKLEFVSMVQRLRGLESNKEYLLRDLAKKESEIQTLRESVASKNKIIQMLTGEDEECDSVSNMSTNDQQKSSQSHRESESKDQIITLDIACMESRNDS